MTKKKENQQSSSVKFKIKIIKIKDIPEPKPIRKINSGIYAQMKNGNKITYDRSQFSLKEMEEVLTKLFYDKKEYINEYRKKSSLGNQISEQTS